MQQEIYDESSDAIVGLKGRKAERRRIKSINVLVVKEGLRTKATVINMRNT